jgi:hypothetical protein
MNTGIGFGDIVSYATAQIKSHPTQEAEEALTSEITTDTSIEVVPEDFTVADLGKGRSAEWATSSEVTQHEYEPSAVSPESNPTAEVVEKNRPVETDGEVPKEQASDTLAVAGTPEKVRLPGDVEPEPSPDLHGLTLPIAEASAQSEMEAGTGGVAENSETDLSSDKAKPAKDAIQDRQPIVVKVVNYADFEKYQSASIGISPELKVEPAAAIISLSGEVKMDKELAQTILTHYNTMHRMLLSESKQELGYVKTAHSQAIRWVMNKYKGDKYVAGIAREVGGFPSLIQLLQKVLE